MLLLLGSEILQELNINITKQFSKSEVSLADIRKAAIESYYDYSGDEKEFDFLERFENKLVWTP